MRRDLVLGRIILGTLLLPLSRTYFAALAVFHSFLAFKERRIQALTKIIIHGATKYTNISFTVAGEAVTTRPGGTVVNWRSFWFMAAEPGLKEQSLCLNNHKWNTVHG